MNLWAIFLTGLTTGGLSCLAMQGGLLASIIANQKEDEVTEVKPLTKAERKQKKVQAKAESVDQLDWMPVGLFLLTKIVAHTILGFFLGWLGSRIELSLSVRLFFQGLAAFFMLATAGNLLDLHPIFRYVVFQPPKFVQRMVRNSTKGKALFTPAVLGLMTILIPCGVTQAMEVLAITSRNAVLGALIMFFFIFGTSPLFAVLGVATAKLSEGYKKNFAKIAATILVLLAINSLNGVLVVLNSPITLDTFTRPVVYFFSDERFAKNATVSAPITSGVQEVLIEVKDNGYQPNYLKVKSGIPVKLTLHSNKVYTCALSFVFKEFNIKTMLADTDTQSFTFTPTRPGKYPFTCSMGMYRGVMEVL